jgi:hypothetical protein
MITLALLAKIDQFVKLAREPLPKYTRTWGPYNRSSNRKSNDSNSANDVKSDKRQIIIVEMPDGSKHTQSYPKFLMEQRLGEKLDPNETVDHRNFINTDNSIDNLQVLDRAEHSALDTRRVKLVDCTCAGCGKPFQRSPRHLRYKAKMGKSGPYCSRSCAARDARYVQYGKKERAPNQQGVASEYYRNKIVDMAKQLAAKWEPELTKLANKHLSHEDEEIALSEIDEKRDTVPVELWRKYKHREVSGVQWRPEEKKPAKKAMNDRVAMNTRFMGGPAPEPMKEEELLLAPKQQMSLQKAPPTPFPRPDIEVKPKAYKESDPAWEEFFGEPEPSSKDAGEFAGDFGPWLPNNDATEQLLDQDIIGDEFPNKPAKL